MKNKNKTKKSQSNYMNVLVVQLCPTLCDPVDWSPLDSSVHGILQTRILKWVANSCLQGNLPDPGRC